MKQEHDDSLLIEGRNEVIEAFRSGRTIDRVYILDGSHDGKLDTIRREAKKAGVRIDYLERKRLDDLSTAGNHQGVIAKAAAYTYASVEDILDGARKKGEEPFIFVLDGIEDPHNLGAMIRTADLAGAHGVIIPKDRAVGLTATVAKSSAGALNYVPVAKVTNLSRTIDELKEKGIWFAGADMDGELMYDCNLKDPIGLVIGAEGKGLSRLVRDKCDYIVRIPTKGNIDSLNASVACGVLAFEIVRQRGR
ncbi:MAG: 23S rRNA (guanosine(2251)-2'-O)-methyltransferase RlmB [Lachnospiraceae bacterium]|nr:23S rRNA (guanosine(2251)-2'-O)-methyltransferase RlmB [Lachnospiraceae bacterium]